MKKVYGKRMLSLLALVVALALVLAACSEANNTDAGPNQPSNTNSQNEQPGSNSQQEQEPDPIDIATAELAPADLRIYSIVTSITEEEFERTMLNPIKAKYPHYNLEYVLSNVEKLENMIIQGRSPDIVITSITNLYARLMPSALEYDLTEFINKYNYDLDRIEPALIESVQNAAPNGEIYGLPKYINGVAMFYNIDLFDHFGVEYPRSGMTWDEVYQLAVNMTRVVDGQQYRGMSFFYNNMFAENQLSLSYFHPTENKAAVNSDGFQKMINEYLRFYQIDGNSPGSSFSADTELNNFYKEKNIAMNLAPLSGFGRFTNDLSFNWEIAAPPTFSDKPGIGFQANTIYYFVSDANKQAEQAFQAVTELLSDEVQLMSSKEGRGTVLKNEDIRATLGKDHPNFKDKNFAALYHNQFAPTPAANPEASQMVNAQNILINGFKEAIAGTVDVNTMLRNVEEQINQAISEAMIKKD